MQEWNDLVKINLTSQMEETVKREVFHMDI